MREGDGGGGCVVIDGAWVRAQVAEAVRTFFAPLGFLWRLRTLAPP